MIMHEHTIKTPDAVLRTEDQGAELRIEIQSRYNFCGTNLKEIEVRDLLSELTAWLEKPRTPAGRSTGRLATETGVFTRPEARASMVVHALLRGLALARVRFTDGLKIRVSPVRFRPWPWFGSTTTYDVTTRPCRESLPGVIPGDSREQGRFALAGRAL